LDGLLILHGKGCHAAMSNIKRKQKPAHIQRRKQETVNKKAIVWTACVLGVIVIAVALLIIFNS
jgi:uncharacterized membrane protein YidH (DUF202 family)